MTLQNELQTASKLDSLVGSCTHQVYVSCKVLDKKKKNDDKEMSLFLTF